MPLLNHHDSTWFYDNKCRKQNEPFYVEICESLSMHKAFEKFDVYANFHYLIIVMIHSFMLIHTESRIFFLHRSMLRLVNRLAYTRDEDKGLSNVSN